MGIDGRALSHTIERAPRRPLLIRLGRLIVSLLYIHVTTLESLHPVYCCEVSGVDSIDILT